MLRLRLPTSVSQRSVSVASLSIRASRCTFKTSAFVHVDRVQTILSVSVRRTRVIHDVLDASDILRPPDHASRNNSPDRPTPCEFQFPEQRALVLVRKGRARRPPEVKNIGCDPHPSSPGESVFRGKSARKGIVRCACNDDRIA